MATPKSIGALELSSIGMGFLVEDEMLKAASVELLIARTICSGKYLIVIGGSVSDVQASIDAGLKRGRRGDDRSMVIPNVMKRCFRRWANRWCSSPSRWGRWA